MTPKGLVTPDEIGYGWGLLEVEGRHVRMVKTAKGFARRARHLEVKFLVAMLIRVKLRLTVDKIERLGDPLNRFVKDLSWKRSK